MSRAVPTTERTRLVPKGSKSLPKQSFVPPPKTKKTQQAREYLPPFLVRDTRVQWKKKRGKGAQRNGLIKSLTPSKEYVEQIEEQPFGRVSAHCLAREFDFDRLRNANLSLPEPAQHSAPYASGTLASPVDRRLSLQGRTYQASLEALDLRRPNTREYESMLHFHYSDEEELFVYDYGTAVMWGFSAENEALLLQYLSNYALYPHEEMESDDLSFVLELDDEGGEGSHSDTPHYEPPDDPRVSSSSVRFQPILHKSEDSLKVLLKNDVIRLRSSDVMLKLSISFAIAQSTALSIVEENIKLVIEENQQLAYELARTGTIPLSSKEMSKRIGALIVQKNMVNLETDILETPEYFWSEDVYLGEYQAARDYLEIRNRMDVLNHRCGILGEMFEMIRSEQEAKHSSYLEWIVIILIVVEVVLEIIELLAVVISERSSG